MVGDGDGWRHTREDAVAALVAVDKLAHVLIAGRVLVHALAMLVCFLPLALVHIPSGVLARALAAALAISPLAVVHVPIGIDHDAVPVRIAVFVLVAHALAQAVLGHLLAVLVLLDDGRDEHAPADLIHGMASTALLGVHHLDLLKPSATSHTGGRARRGLVAVCTRSRRDSHGGLSAVWQDAARDSPCAAAPRTRVGRRRSSAA